jgi:hypothetical protein
MQNKFLLLILIGALVLISTPTTAQVSNDDTVDIEGALVPLSPEAQSEWMQNREDLESHVPVDVPSNVALLHTQNQGVYGVFLDEAPRVAEAQVTGYRTHEPADGTPGIIVATDVEFSQSGQPIDYADLKSDPREYHLEIVTFSTKVSEIAYTSEAQSFQQRQTVGFVNHTAIFPLFGASIGESPSAPVGRAGHWGVKNLSASDDMVTTALRRFFTVGDISMVSNRRAFWKRGVTNVTALIYHDSTSSELSLSETIAYVVNSEVHAKEISGPSAVSKQEEGYIVRFESDLAGSKISSNEAILNAAPCGSRETDMATFPPTGCIPVVTDSIVHTGVLFSSDMNRVGDAVFYAGVSNSNLDQVAAAESGRYQITGRVVDSSAIDPRLPSEKAIVVYDRERMGSITIPSGFQRQSKLVRDQIESQITMTGSDWSTTENAALAGQAAATQTETPTPTASPSQTPSPSPTDSPTPDGSQQVAIETVGTTPNQDSGSPLEVVKPIISILAIISSAGAAIGTVHSIYVFKRYDSAPRFSLNTYTKLAVGGLLLAFVSAIAGYDLVLLFAILLLLPTMGTIFVVWFGAFLES